MITHAEWGIIGTGLCGDCRSAEVLVTNSLANYSSPEWEYPRLVACFSCHHSYLMRLVRHTRALNDEGFRLDEETSPYSHVVGTLFQERPQEREEFREYFAGIPTCGCCSEALLPSDAENITPYYETVDAYDHTRTIIVQAHRKCTNIADCCGTSYIDAWSRTGMRMIIFEGDKTCSICLELELKERGHVLSEDYYYCESCNSHENLETNRPARWNRSIYCRPCYDHNVFECDDCGAQYWQDDGHDCSYESEDDRSYEFIHEYSYKPRPYFFGKSENPNERLFFGIELEVESSGGNIDETSALVVNELGARVYLKEDGSLNHGFEIVTHPHSLDSLRKEFKWESFARFRKAGLRSWDTDTCGLHVHVSRDAFGISYDNRTEYSKIITSRQSHELRFMKLIYDNQRQVERLAGRSSPSYANFMDKKHLVRKVRYGTTEGGRHAAVNTDNDNTLEVRVFKGSLIPERVLGCVEFVHASVEYTRNLRVTGSKAMVRMPDGKMRSTALSWLAFAGYVHQNVELYPNLTALMVKTLDNDYSVE